MRFPLVFRQPLIRVLQWIIAVVSTVGLVFGIVVLAGAHIEVTSGQATLLISVCSLTLIIDILFLTIHYKVDATHLRLNIAFVDMLSGRIKLENILNIVIQDGVFYISYLWKGPDPVIAAVMISPKRYKEMKELLMSQNLNIVFYEKKDDEPTDSE